MSKKIIYSPKVAIARDEYLEVIARMKKEKSDALERWNDLSVKDVDRATTLVEAKKAFNGAPWGAPAKKYALKKWAELCATGEDLKEIYEVSRGRFGVWHEDNPALERWINWSGERVESASSFEEASMAFKSAPQQGLYDEEARDVRCEAFSKWLSFCLTLDDLERIRKYFGNIPEDGVYRQLYLNKHDELYLKQA